MYNAAAEDQGLSQAQSGDPGRRQTWFGRRFSSVPGEADTRRRDTFQSGSLRNQEGGRGRKRNGTKEETRLESGHFQKRKSTARNSHGAQTRTSPLNKKWVRMVGEEERKKQQTRQTSSISSASSYLRLMKIEKTKKRRKEKAGICNLLILQLLIKALYLVQRGEPAE